VLNKCGTRILRVIHGRDARATSTPEACVPNLAQLERWGAYSRNQVYQKRRM